MFENPGETGAAGFGQDPVDCAPQVIRFAWTSPLLLAPSAYLWPGLLSHMCFAYLLCSLKCFALLLICDLELLNNLLRLGQAVYFCSHRERLALRCFTCVFVGKGFGHDFTV